jgi:hypothetical protein
LVNLEAVPYVGVERAQRLRALKLLGRHLARASDLIWCEQWKGAVVGGGLLSVSAEAESSRENVIG